MNWMGHNSGLATMKTLAQHALIKYLPTKIRDDHAQRSIGRKAWRSCMVDNPAVWRTQATTGHGGSEQ
jgi:hypothetical protein